MLTAAKGFVRTVDAINAFVGKFAMYLLFALAAILLYATGSRLFLGMPINWSLEMSQFVLSAYYLLGGAYSVQMGSHVRMDLFYSRWQPKRRSVVDAFTIIFVIIYLVLLLRGAISSTEYSITYNQRNYTSWAPVLWPIKVVMTTGIFLMLLQMISQFIKDIAIARGKPLT